MKACVWGGNEDNCDDLEAIEAKIKFNYYKALTFILATYCICVTIEITIHYFVKKIM